MIPISGGDNGGGDRGTGDRTTPREAVVSLPIIDVSSFLTAADDQARRHAAAQLRAACINVGFFYITGHGIEQRELDDCEAHAHRFFELPADVKMQYRSAAAAQAGYVRIGGVAPGSTAAKSPDQKERFVMIRALTAEAITAPSRTHWPADNVLAGFTRVMQAQLEKRTRLAHALARAFALSLHLPETWFDPYFRDMALVSIINYYPSLAPEAHAKQQWSFSPHTDYGGFTLLSQDRVGGLQVMNCAGDWIDVPPIEGTFVVNIGDLMARWTNDVYTSNPHRAANVSGVSRISIPFFASPHPDAVIECIETCRSETDPPRYPPVTCGEYLRHLITQSDRTGRPGISERTSQRLNT